MPFRGAVGEGVEGAKEAYNVYKETKEKIAQAQEAEENAKLFQKLAHERVESWADLSGRAQDEETKVTDWLTDLARSHKHRGSLLELTKKRLGAQLPQTVSGKIAGEMMRAFELELFRHYYREKKAAIVGIGYWGYEDYGAFQYRIEIGPDEWKAGPTITEVVRKHLINDLIKELPSRYLDRYAQELVDRWATTSCSTTRCSARRSGCTCARTFTRWATTTRHWSAASRRSAAACTTTPRRCCQPSCAPCTRRCCNSSPY